jgi:ribosomal protein S18 acetylase RimI-like enzyme
MGLFSNAIINLEHCQLKNSIAEHSVKLLASEFAASPPWLNLGISAQRLERYFLSDDVSLRRYFIVYETKTAGCVCIRYPWLRGAYIEFLGLTSSFRGLGLGAEILQWVEMETIQESKNLWVLSSSFNHGALAFYQRLGFYRIGLIEGLIVPELDEVLLRKRLNNLTIHNNKP